MACSEDVRLSGQIGSDRPTVKAALLTPNGRRAFALAPVVNFNLWLGLGAAGHAASTCISPNADNQGLAREGLDAHVAQAAQTPFAIRHSLFAPCRIFLPGRESLAASETS
jgi:hypothetical protein